MVAGNGLAEAPSIKRSNAEGFEGRTQEGRDRQAPPAEPQARSRREGRAPQSEERRSQRTPPARDLQRRREHEQRGGAARRPGSARHRSYKDADRARRRRQ